MSAIDVISDHANKNLNLVPQKVLEMYNLKMLYLEGNLIESLPDDFFAKLGRLTWLDLRNNQLKTIPKGIAHHKCLETMLLRNNEIEELPNEIGLVPTLTVLQLAENPLRYPDPELVQEGTAAVCRFLKQEYQKLNEKPTSEDDEEREVSVVNSKSTSQLSSGAEKLSVKELLRRSAKKRKGYSLFMPVINVRSLSKMNQEQDDSVQLRKSGFYASHQPSPAKKVHKITRGCSKLSLRSQSQWNAKKKMNPEERAQENELKEMWLERLKELLADQEKILQQEKNLRALSKWRLDKKAEPPKTPNERQQILPFATDPEYNRMLTRKELTEQIDNMIKKSKKTFKKTYSQKMDIQKLINQVVEQMRDMETKLGKASSPRTEQDIAAKQIESIVELHKKIIKLQERNAENI